jgi:hypothetical protein
MREEDRTKKYDLWSCVLEKVKLPIRALLKQFVATIRAKGTFPNEAPH